MTAPRHDPGAEPRLARPRRNALHGQRQIVPALHEPATPDPIDDDAREFVAQEVDVPTIVRRAATTTEAIRQYAATVPRDSVALDPSHGIAQVEAMRAARDREAHLAALIDDALRDGATTGAAIAARLTAMGVGVRR